MPTGVMQEAIDKEDFDRMEKGLPARPKVKPKLVVPDPPLVKNQLRVEDVPFDGVKSLDAKRRVERNTEGMIFIGFDVTIGVAGKKPLTGWMAEGDFYTLKREVESRIDTSKIEF